MMKHSLLPAMVAAVMATACQPAAAPLTDEDIAAIRDVSDAWVQAARQNDWSAIAELYTEDCVVMPPNEPAFEGRDAFLAWGATFPPFAAFNTSVDEVDGYGDLAYVRGSYAMTLQPEGMPAIEDRGKFLEVRRRQPDGSWKIAVDMFSSDIPLPE